jgi:hypothetical protein
LAAFAGTHTSPTKTLAAFAGTHTSLTEILAAFAGTHTSLTETSTAFAETQHTTLVNIFQFIGNLSVPNIKARRKKLVHGKKKCIIYFCTMPDTRLTHVGIYLKTKVFI